MESKIIKNGCIIIKYERKKRYCKYCEELLPSYLETWKTHHPKCWYKDKRIFINVANSDGHCDELVFYDENKHDNIIKYSRKKITTKHELEEYPIGSLISYTNKKNEFRKAGYVLKYSDNYFIYVTPDFQTKYRVKYKNVLEMWVKKVDSPLKDLIWQAETIQEKTNFPIFIGNKVIYYAKNNSDRDKYMDTTKYKKLVKWYDHFGNNQTLLEFLNTVK